MSSSPSPATAITFLELLDRLLRVLRCQQGKIDPALLGELDDAAYTVDQMRMEAHLTHGALPKLHEVPPVGWKPRGALVGGDLR